jgi:hypothetical protein
VTNAVERTTQPANRLRTQRSVAGWQIFLGSWAFFVIVSLIRLHRIFTFTIHEDGDAALNSLSVIHAEHVDQLVGNYSRTGFHHPGPALFYVLAAGQALFHGLLHVAPAPANGQELAVVLFGTALIALAVRILYRMTGSLAGAVLALGAFSIFALNHGVYGELWFPNLYIAPFLVLMVSGATVAIGNTSELPWLALSSCLLIQGHISFVMFVLVTDALVGLCHYGGLFRHKANSIATTRTEPVPIRGGRVYVSVSVVIVAVFALPMIADVILHYPGQWPKYVHYVLHGQHDPRTARNVLDFFAYYWTHGQPVVVSIVAVCCAVALIATEREPDRRATFGSLYAVVALQSLLTLIYISRGVDQLIPLNHYVGYFYEAAPVLLTVAAATHLVTRARTMLAADHKLRRVPTLVGAAAGIALLLYTAFSSNWQIDTGSKQADADYPQIVAALETDPARQGRTVELDFPHDSWPEAAGIAIEASRKNVPYCVVNTEQWANLFGADKVCPGPQGQSSSGPAGTSANKRLWHAGVGPLTWMPAGAAIIWKGQDSVVFAFPDEPSAG